MLGSLEGSARGKSPERSRATLAALSGPYKCEALERAVALGGGYDAKLPDSDLEVKLGAVDWERDDVLLYVGRLIAAKGPHKSAARGAPPRPRRAPPGAAPSGGPRAAARAA